MSKKAKKEYLTEIRKRYKQRVKKKMLIEKEFIEIVVKKAGTYCPALT